MALEFKKTNTKKKREWEIIKIQNQPQLQKLFGIRASRSFPGRFDSQIPPFFFSFSFFGFLRFSERLLSTVNSTA